MNAPPTVSKGGRYLAVWRGTHIFEATFGDLLAAYWTGLIIGELPAVRRHPEAARPGGRWPYPSRSFHVAYLMHVFEHHTEVKLEKAAAEVFRVLKPGGILRVSTPDLEREARQYLSRLDRARQSADPLDRSALDLARLRMIDQCVRFRPGGEMAAAIRRGGQRESDIVATFGQALDFIRTPQPWVMPRGWRRRRFADAPYALLRKLVTIAGRGHPVVTGELDRIKPDFYLLRDVLNRAGFNMVERRVADESSIRDWDRWDFDRSKDGNKLEPGLYMEAIRP